MESPAVLRGSNLFLRVSITLQAVGEPVDRSSLEWGSNQGASVGDVRGCTRPVAPLLAMPWKLKDTVFFGN